MKKRLQRPYDDRIIAGVCAGLADYFGIDRTIMRLIYIVLSFLSVGTGVLVYLLLWFLMPEGPGQHNQNQQTPHD